MKELTDRVAELQERVEEKSGRPVGPDRDELAKIRLPDNPTREQAADYIEQILRASEKQTAWQADDPQVEMLARVGPKYFDLLLERRLSDSRWYYLESALERLADEDHKTQVLNALRADPRLVAVVIKKGWAADAKDTLVAMLKERAPEMMPMALEWVQAVASLNDPTTYPVLREYLINGPDPSWTWLKIEELPGANVDEWLSVAWEKRRSDPGLFDSEAGFVVAAAAHGHADALVPLFQVLADNNLPDGDGNRVFARRAVVALVDVVGTDQELVRSFNQNRGRLRWDLNARKYVVAAPAAGPASRPAGS